MTKYVRFTCQCPRCNRLFRRFIEIVDDKDKAMLKKYIEDIQAGIFDCTIKGLICSECNDQLSYIKLDQFGLSI